MAGVRWVKMRGQLRAYDLKLKCNNPNGLSIDFVSNPKVMSYRLDDPGGARSSLAEPCNYTQAADFGPCAPTWFLLD